MRYGAHLPLIDFDGRGWTPAGLSDYARATADLGFSAVAANDHLTFSRPWLDGIVALAAVVEASGDLALATTAALPVIRGAAALAATADALDALSGGRLRLGVAPGSSPADFAMAGIEARERWRRFEEAIGLLRRHRPDRPIWVASWGSPAGLRRVARLGDGWLASAYNTTPTLLVERRTLLARELAQVGRPDVRLPCTLATMWLHVTDRPAEAEATLDLLAETLGRGREALADRLLVGSAESCARLLQAYAEAGVDLLCLWPVVDPVAQLERFVTEVVPLTR